MADHVNKIPVVIAFDQDYLPPAVVMLTSLLSNASKSTFFALIYGKPECKKRSCGAQKGFGSIPFKIRRTGPSAASVIL